MIPRVACGIYVKALEYCIRDGKISLSPKLLEQIYEIEFMQMQPFLTAVRSKDYESISKYRNGIDLEAMLLENSIGTSSISANAVKIHS